MSDWTKSAAYVAGLDSAPKPTLWLKDLLIALNGIPIISNTAPARTLTMKDYRRVWRDHSKG